jgi:hypothetical protein
MASEFVPHWVEHPEREPEAPKSWVFYVVSRIDEQYRPLAVVHRYPNSDSQVDADKSRNIASPCLRLVKILSDQANRIAIESEIAIAASFYRDEGVLRQPPVELPEPYWIYKPRRAWSDHWHQEGIREFPFISTCAVVGTGNGYPFSYPDGGPLPLNTLWRDTDMVHGMIVVDVTDLENIRYGIVCFKIRNMVWVNKPNLELEGNFTVTVVPKLVEDRPRRPLSIGDYVSMFGHTNTGEIEMLSQIPIVDVDAMRRKS